MITTWNVESGENGMRLDQFVARRAGCSRAASRRLIDGGTVRINNGRARKGSTVQSGDRISVAAPLPAPDALRPVAQPELPLVVLHVDDDLVAVCKPAGMPTHPLHLGETGTLANAVVARYPECATVGNDPREAGMAHRLDGDTSGVLVVARNQAAWESLRAAFAGGAVEKEYLALVAGVVSDAHDVDKPLRHDTRDRRKMIAVGTYDDAEDARPARSRVAPLATAGDFSLVVVRTSTGRMHQVRVHLASIGHPIVGDELYGGPPAPDGATRHFLHASRLRAPHPRGGTLEVTAPLPEDRAAALAGLGFAGYG